MPVDLERSRKLVALLKESTSLTVVKEFLKTKPSLTFSAGSWEEMIDKRLMPALENSEISNDELETMVQESEEYGKQHIFLYSCDPNEAKKMIDRQTIISKVQNLNLGHLLQHSQLIEEPQGVELVDIRWESNQGQDYKLILKEVELKTYHRLTGTRENGDEFLKVYHIERERAVNVVSLSADGHLEVRLTSHKNSSRYDDDIFNIFTRLEAFLDRRLFSEFSLTKAKNHIWKNRQTLKSEIRYVDSKMRNSLGNLLSGAAGGKDLDLNDDNDVAGSLDALQLKDKNSYCDSTNIYFKPKRPLTSELHVLISGEANEFAIPANCSKLNYEHILERLRHFNK